MELHKAINFFQDLLKNTERHSESKLYQRYIGILSSLKTIGLTEEQMLSIEEKLDTLNLKADAENQRRYLRRKLTELLKFLKEEFSLITEGYYKGNGLALGLAFGVAFGAVFNPGVGIALGMVFGLSIGSKKDKEAEKQNRVLKT